MSALRLQLLCRSLTAVPSVAFREFVARSRSALERMEAGLTPVLAVVSLVLSLVAIALALWPCVGRLFVRAVVR